VQWPPEGNGLRSGGGEDLLGDRDRGERLGPAGVEREVRDRLDEFVLGGAAVLGVLQVEVELFGVPAGDERGDGDQAAVARRELRALRRCCGRFLVL
jgi:hypothetical protein